MKRTLAQNNKIYMLIAAVNKAGYLVEKAEIVSFITDGRTSSSKELTYQEALKLIHHLEEKLGQDAKKFKPASDSKRADNMRKNIIAICYELGWITNSEDLEEKKMNMAVIDSFLKSRGYLKKPLMEFTIKELPKLVTQFNQILEHSKKTAGNKATKNLLQELNIPVQPNNKK